MNDNLVSLHFQAIRQLIGRLQQEDATAWTEIETVFEDLRVICEEMQNNLELALVIEQQLSHQNQHYYDLFQAAPIAYLTTNVDGSILEANQAIARLLNVSQSFLIRKPFVLYVAESDRQNFYARLNQILQEGDPQVWQMTLAPRRGTPFAAQLQVAVSYTPDGCIENLKIGVFDLSQSRPAVSSFSEELRSAPDSSLAAQPIPVPTRAAEISMSPLPYALDGLRVLVVDDEAGICKFITALLESHGIAVKTVTSSAAALEEIEQFQPDVLLSDIRLCGGDGYDLIRQIRALEANQGRHIPAAAITAYLDEDREKALNAGFEAYWYKLSQPTELVEVVAQLAESATQERS